MCDYAMPDTDVTVPEGTCVMISVKGLHMDPNYHPEPEIFNPERFSEENKSNIRGYTYMPFGEGPHNCIGEAPPKGKKQAAGRKHRQVSREIESRSLD